MKTLIVYYSLTGQTEVLAESLAKNLNAELFRVEARKPERVVSFRTFKIGIQSRLMRTNFETLRKSRIQLKVARMGFEKYDAIVIATPIWGNFFPPAMITFLELNHFKGRKVALVATSVPFSKAKAAIDFVAEKLTEVNAKLIFSAEVKPLSKSKNVLALTGEKLAREIKAKLKY